MPSHAPPLHWVGQLYMPLYYTHTHTHIHLRSHTTHTPTSTTRQRDGHGKLLLGVATRDLRRAGALQTLLPDVSVVDSANNLQLHNFADRIVWPVLPLRLFGTRRATSTAVGLRTFTITATITHAF